MASVKYMRTLSTNCRSRNGSTVNEQFDQPVLRRTFNTNTIDWGKEQLRDAPIGAKVLLLHRTMDNSSYYLRKEGSTAFEIVEE
jgi:hypothetical protein